METRNTKLSTDVPVFLFLGVFDSDTGDEIRQSEVPFPCDILSCFSCPNVDRAVTVLQNGLVQVWNLGYDTSDKK